MATNYYTLLGISRDASHDDIRKAYKSLALSWHPDRNPSSDASKMFQMIHDAYQVLNNPEKRKEYDKSNVSYSYQSAKRDTWFDNPTITSSVKVPWYIARYGGNIQKVVYLPEGERLVEIAIPVMLNRHDRLIIKNSGSKINPTSPPGDLEFVCDIDLPKDFSWVDNKNIMIEKTVGLVTAMRGGEQKLVWLDKEISFMLKEGTQYGSLIHLPGEGWSGSDLLIKILIEIPTWEDFCLISKTIHS